jgi:N-acyl-D-aspartate/D-glutamate deacylase
MSTSYDIKITGGTVVDGSGNAPFESDLAIKDGRIVEIGACSGTAARTIDARGAIVTPGFVDIHTHYDGQVSWDNQLAPSCYHGVTTAIMGSCGVGFAPVRTRDHERLIDLMQGVEDIPGTALAEGLTWDWETFPEYMSALDSRPHVMDFGCQIPHDALRVYVMGERGIAQEQASDEDIARMRDLVREAIEAGAMGFSTGRTDNHRAADGSATPASEASDRELAGIAAALRGLDHGVLQAVSDFDMAESPKRFDGEFDVLERMAEAAGGRPLSISLLQRGMATDQWRKIVARAESASQRGLDIRLQVGARGIGVILGLDATFHPFMGFPSYKAVSHLPLRERVQAMRAPGFRERLVAEKSERVSGDGSPIPPLADFFLANLEFLSMSLYRLGDPPNYEPAREDSLLAESYRTGRPLLEVIFDALLEDDGAALLYFPIYNYLEQNLDVVREMIANPLALAGLSDGGAHVGTICDASFPSFLLSYWTRDRERGRFPLERIVRMLTRANADFIGLPDRGLLAPGLKADVNVIDYAGLSIGKPHLVADLPAGGKRFLQSARGYLATITSGVVTLERDELTGENPGRLVRSGITGR